MNEFSYQEYLGKIIARMGCPPGTERENCTIDFYEDIDEICAACWIEFIEPFYNAALAETAERVGLDTTKIVLLGQSGEQPN